MTGCLVCWCFFFFSVICSSIALYPIKWRQSKSQELFLQLTTYCFCSSKNRVGNWCILPTYYSKNCLHLQILYNHKKNTVHKQEQQIMSDFPLHAGWEEGFDSILFVFWCKKKTKTSLCSIRVQRPVKIPSLKQSLYPLWTFWIIPAIIYSSVYNLLHELKLFLLSWSALPSTCLVKRIIQLNQWTTDWCHWQLKRKTTAA